MAAPTEGISVDGMLELFQGLHRAGAPIEVMNAFRKRVMRWGAGRLAVALQGAQVTALIASDVIGDDPSAIASGPCSGDHWHVADLVELAQAQRLWPHIPDEVRQYIDRTLLGIDPSKRMVMFQHMLWSKGLPCSLTTDPDVGSVLNPPANI